MILLTAACVAALAVIAFVARWTFVHPVPDREPGAGRRDVRPASAGEAGVPTTS